MKIDDYIKEEEMSLDSNDNQDKDDYLK